MSTLGTPRIATTHGGKPKARGAGQPPRKYTLWEWTKGYAMWLATLPLFPIMWFLSGRKLPAWIVRKLLRNWTKTTESRERDVRIPGDPAIAPYMLRWWKIMRNAMLNIYYHNVKRSDDDTAHHDHPWWSFSIVLEGGYYEEKIMAGGIHVRTWYGPGSMLFRHSGTVAHRLVLDVHTPTPEEYHQDDDGPADDPWFAERPVKTIFITGPVLRRWGFHHTEQWVDAYDWDDYCQARGLAGHKMSGYAEQLKKE